MTSSSAAEQQLHGETQTDLAGKVQDASIQTHKKQGKKHSASKFALNIDTQQSDEFDDSFVTNAVCPPPLYYNSEAGPKPKVLQGLQQTKLEDADSGSDESLSTIRHEDKFSDSDEEFLDKGPKPETVLQQKHPHSEKQDDIISSWLNTAPRKQQAGTPRFANFPVLNALLQEIATIPGVQAAGLQSLGQPGAATAGMSTSPKTKTPRSARFTPRPAELKDGDVVSRLSSPRRPQKAEPAAKPQPKGGTAVDAKQKGWLRRQAPVGMKTTKLTYGMTKTQRLRLAKGNPELLKTLEKTEQERLEKRRDEQLNKYPWLRRDSGYMKLGTADLTTEISKHPCDEAIPKLDLQDMETDAGANTELKPHRKPVPTPRLSLSLTDKDKPLLTPRPRPSKSRLQMSVLEHQSPRDAKAAVDQDNSVSHSSRHKSIEVHVPSAATDDQAESEATSVSGSELDMEELEDVMGKTRTIHTPGFLQESVDTTKYSNGVHHYSEDFEDENLTSPLGEEPALKKVVDEYSDSDSAPSHDWTRCWG